jgi:hypothetical protein
MNEPNENPSLHGWRIKSLEDSLAGLHLKLDRLNDAVVKNGCPQPGLCLQVKDITDRITGMLETHARRLAEVETQITVAKTSGRILIAAAAGLGTIVAGVVSLAINVLK